MKGGVEVLKAVKHIVFIKQRCGIRLTENPACAKLGTRYSWL